MTQPYSTRTVNDLTFNTLTSAIYSNPFYLYDIDAALYNDADAYTLMMRDADIAASAHQLFHEIAATEWAVEPGGKDPASVMKASIIDDMLKRTNMTEAIFELASAILKGRAYQYPIGARTFTSYGDLQPQFWWTPIKLKDIDKRRVRLVPTKYKLPNGRYAIRVHKELWSVANYRYEPMSPQFEAALIELVYGDEEARLGYGSPLGEQVYFYWRAKALCFKEGLQGVERWAQGILIAKLDADRPADTAKTNEALADDLLVKLQNMRSRHVVVVGKDQGEIEYHESSGGGQKLVMEFIHYLDSKIARLLLGAIMPSGGGDDATGTQAKAVVQERSTSRRVLYHRKRIEDVLTQKLIGTICRVNQPQFMLLGLAQAKAPRFKIIDEQIRDPKAAMELIKAAQDVGMDVLAEEAYELAQLTRPKPGEEILSAPAPASPFGDPFGGGPGGPGAPPFGGKGKDQGSGQGQEQKEPQREPAQLVRRAGSEND